MKLNIQKGTNEIFPSRTNSNFFLVFHITKMLIMEQNI
jgi:hypothetical protein